MKLSLIQGLPSTPHADQTHTDFASTVSDARRPSIGPKASKGPIKAVQRQPMAFELTETPPGKATIMIKSLAHSGLDAPGLSCPALGSMNNVRYGLEVIENQCPPLLEF